MRSFERVTPEASRSDNRLQPTQLEAALIRRAAVRVPDDPDAVAAKVNRFGFVSRSFKQSVHIFLMPKKSDSGDNRLGGRGEEAR
jgi:hypothetical protein